MMGGYPETAKSPPSPITQETTGRAAAVVPLCLERLAFRLARLLSHSCAVFGCPDSANAASARYRGPAVTGSRASRAACAAVMAAIAGSPVPLPDEFGGLCGCVAPTRSSLVRSLHNGDKHRGLSRYFRVDRLSKAIPTASVHRVVYGGAGAAVRQKSPRVSSARDGGRCRPTAVPLCLTRLVYAADASTSSTRSRGLTVPAYVCGRHARLPSFRRAAPRRASGSLPPRCTVPRLSEVQECPTVPVRCVCRLEFPSWDWH
jgi:hypothetical protein